MTLTKPRQVVRTNEARCMDCYRCLRVCPVKAIRMSSGQAFVHEDRCIGCGRCIGECPQDAKVYRRDVDKLSAMLERREKVAISLAPSFVASFEEWERKRIASALRREGVGYIAETSVGAYYVSMETRRFFLMTSKRPLIATACPAVVNYIQKYKPNLVEHLVPLVSPMLAHGHHIKEVLGQDWKVVFVGPCVAKKMEADSPRNRNDIDVVITFEELKDWLAARKVHLEECEETDFDEEPCGDARLFPLLGGLPKTAGLDGDIMSTQVHSVSGFEELEDLLLHVRDEHHLCLIDALFCQQGCVGGPAMATEKSLFERKKSVVSYAQRARKALPAEDTTPNDYNLSTHFAPLSPLGVVGTFSESSIHAILERTGKACPEDQLNCGACGYESCREKAIAVLQGMAEVEMCIPFMRRLAEQRTDRIIETSPNGIVMLDAKLNIISMNPAFRKFFLCSEAVIGRRISYLMDAEPFERIATASQDLVEVTVNHSRYNIVCHELIYPIREENQYVGIFVNITSLQKNQKKLADIKGKTVEQATELMEHQIKMANELARMLGEHSARTEEMVENLLKIANDSPVDTDDWKKAFRK